MQPGWERLLKGHSRHRAFFRPSIRFIRILYSFTQHYFVFNHIKEFGDIGAPCFVKEDGITTLKLEDVGLVEYTPDGSACCLNGKVC